MTKSFSNFLIYTFVTFLHVYIFFDVLHVCAELAPLKYCKAPNPLFSTTIAHIIPKIVLINPV